jgi:hypothetical protein
MAYWAPLPLWGMDGHQIKRPAVHCGICGRTVWPLVARAQQRESTRRIGVIMLLAEDDSEQKVRFGAVLQRLQ